MLLYCGYSFVISCLHCVCSWLWIQCNHLLMEIFAFVCFIMLDFPSMTNCWLWDVKIPSCQRALRQISHIREHLNFYFPLNSVRQFTFNLTTELKGKIIFSSQISSPRQRLSFLCPLFLMESLYSLSLSNVLHVSFVAFK